MNALRVTSWIVVPIAAPGWAIENVVRRLREKEADWQFRTIVGGVYVLTWIAVGLLLTLAHPVWLKLLGLYILLAVEVLGIVLCAVIILGNSAGMQTRFSRLARRRRPIEGWDRLGSKSIYTALGAFLFSPCFFGALLYVLQDLSLTTYSGIKLGDSGELFEFVYMSFVAIVTLNFTDVTPIGPLAKSLFVIQFALGLAFSLLVFSLFVDQLVRRRRGKA